MPSVFDVAAYILRTSGEMTAMKLQKLAYYSQAWSLVWDDAPIFHEKIEAWANGPVCPALFDRHRGRFLVKPGDFQPGDPDTLSVAQRETVDMVLRFYGGKPAQWLSDLTHSEDPWRLTWGDRPFNATCHEEIPLHLIHEYYSNLLDATETDQG